MKSNRFLVIATVLIVLWETLFGHLGGVGHVDFLLCFSIIFFLKWPNKRAYLLWLVLMTLLVDFVRVDWFGFSLIYVVGTIFLLRLIDRFFKIIDGERYVLVYVFSVLFSELIIYILYIINSDVVAVKDLVYSFVLNLLVIIILGIVSSRYFKDRSIIV